MFDDLKKLFESQILLSLDRSIMPRLLSLTYWTGLAAIILMAINHLFSSFALGFGAGLWGILEIGIFGLLSFFALRLVLEVAAMHFAKNGAAKEPDIQGTNGPSLLEEVRGAIEDLAKDDPVSPTLLDVKELAAKPATPKAAASKTVSKPAAKSTAKPAAKTPVKAPRRTAKRSPAKPKASS